MATPPRPTPLPLLAKINALIIDLAALADAIERERHGRPVVREPRITGDDQATFRERLETLRHAGAGDNVIPFPPRNPRR